ncbi:MAG: PRC-barrel domain-containing protein [Pseudomonadota bacterium]
MRLPATHVLWLALLVACGGAAEPAHGTQPPNGPQQQASLNLVSSEQLVGREVMTREGETVGRLEFVTIAFEEGTVSHLIVDTAGAATDATGQAGAGGGELLVVPWNIAAMNDDGEGIAIQATGEQIANAPRLRRQELARLAEPDIASYVVDYWAPASELAAMEAQNRQPARDPERGPDQQQQQREQQQRQRTEPQTRSDNPGADRGAPQARMQDRQRVRDPERHDPAMQERMREQRPMQRPSGDPQRMQERMQREERMQEQSRRQAESGTQAPAPSGDPARQQGGQTERSTRAQRRQQPGAGGQRMVLVGQEVVTSVAPPMLQVGQQLRGATVTDREGNRLGEIRRIMLDPERGAAAYAIIEDSDAGRAVPVPVQSLEWAAEGATRLNADPSLLQADASLTEPQGRVAREQVGRLYQQFGVSPYWENTAAGDTGAPQP